MSAPTKAALSYLDGEWWCVGNMAVGTGMTPAAAYSDMLWRRWAR